MATTDDLVLLDRAVSNYRKAELFRAELGNRVSTLLAPGSVGVSRLFAAECSMHPLVANGAMATAVSGGLAHSTSGSS
jgi:hypothetical protein